MKPHEVRCTFDTVWECVIPRVFQKRMIKMDTAWKRACETASCPERIFLDLRRTAVRNLERAGVPRSIATSETWSTRTS